MEEGLSEYKVSCWRTRNFSFRIHVTCFRYYFWNYSFTFNWLHLFVISVLVSNRNALVLEVCVIIHIRVEVRALSRGNVSTVSKFLRSLNIPRKRYCTASSWFLYYCISKQRTFCATNICVFYVIACRILVSEIPYESAFDVFLTSWYARMNALVLPRWHHCFVVFASSASIRLSSH